MTPTAIVLLAISAITHVGWNLLGKREHPSTAFFGLAYTTGVLFLLPVLFSFSEAPSGFPPTLWILLIATGLCQAVYIAGLANAYQQGDLSVVYPIVRGLPVLLVALLTRILNTGEPIGLWGLSGMLLIALGTVILPLRKVGDIRLCTYLNRSFLFALIAALGTTGYALIDDAALRLLRNTPGLTLASWQQALIYACLEGLATFLWLLPFIAGRAEGRAQTREILSAHLLQMLLTGAGIVLTYGLVLISLAFVTNVGYVVAFRQLSIPLAALLGITFLNEPRPVPKLAGITILFLGLILVATD